MKMNEFQEQAFEKAFYPNKGNNLSYVILGLNEEAGEVAGKVKKMLRDDNGVMSKEVRDAIIKELGDTLWYVACAAIEINATLEEIAQTNINKINSRKERGKLQGSGDDR